jgi:purine-binding chemotaxis protein CheW
LRNVRQAAVPQVQLVTFRVGGEEFGLDVFSVHEILNYQQPTPMPRAPDFVEGVLDVRGTLVPIVDLRRRFETPDVVYDADTRIVLVDFNDERLGLVVDSVTEVLRAPRRPCRRRRPTSAGWPPSSCAASCAWGSGWWC